MTARPHAFPLPVLLLSDPSILKKTVRGAGWTVAWRIATRMMGTVNTLILARLLLPADFGLVALATGFAQTLLALSSLGTAEAVIRAKSPSRALYDTAFTLNVLRGALTSIAIVLCAWPVAAFFADERLAPVLVALAVCYFVSSCENIGTIEYFRDFAFDKEFKLKLLPRLAGVAATIAAGLIWRNHWALIAGIATSQMLGTAMSYAMHPYRPRFGLSAWSQLAHFSLWSWAIAVATMVRDRVDGFVVGRVLGMTQVGVYALGGDIATMATYELAAPVGRASFAGFAAESRTGAETSASYLRILSSVTLVVLPVGAGVSLVAGPMVALLFGAKWQAAADVVRVLGVAGIASALGTITGSLLTVHGVLRPTFFILLLSMVVRAAGAVVLVHFLGLTGAALAQALAYLVENLGFLAVAFRRFGIRPADYLALTWRAALAAAVMAAVLTGTGLGTDTVAPARSLALAIPAGVAIYGVVLVGAWLASGRPRGAEADLLELARRAAWVAGLWRRRSGDG